MNKEQIAIIRSTWSSAIPHGEELATLFYERLFELDPSLRKHFRGDMHELGRRMMQMVDTAVYSLDRTAMLSNVFGTLGEKNACRGIRPNQYATFGAAWLWTLAVSLQERFTPSAEVAWTAFYGLIARCMRQGAKQLLSA